MSPVSDRRGRQDARRCEGHALDGSTRPSAASAHQAAFVAFVGEVPHGADLLEYVRLNAAAIAIPAGHPILRLPERESIARRARLASLATSLRQELVALEDGLEDGLWSGRLLELARREHRNVATQLKNVEDRLFMLNAAAGRRWGWSDLDDDPLRPMNICRNIVGYEEARREIASARLRDTCSPRPRLARGARARRRRERRACRARSPGNDDSPPGPSRPARTRGRCGP
jgi:hypothetical protein